MQIDDRSSRVSLTARDSIGIRLMGQDASAIRPGVELDTVQLFKNVSIP